MQPKTHGVRRPPPALTSPLPPSLNKPRHSTLHPHSLPAGKDGTEGVLGDDVSLLLEEAMASTVQSGKMEDLLMRALTLLTFGIVGRGDDTRMLNLCHILPILQLTTTWPFHLPVLAFVLHGGKRNHVSMPLRTTAPRAAARPQPARQQPARRSRMPRPAHRALHTLPRSRCGAQHATEPNATSSLAARLPVRCLLAARAGNLQGVCPPPPCAHVPDHQPWLFSCCLLYN